LGETQQNHPSVRLCLTSPHPGRTQAFTLAEVLITLVIIGVIAAITVPTLINKMQREEVETKLKRFYSVMNQAINMSKIDNGDFKQWDYSALDGTYEGNKAFFDKYIGKYLSNVKVKEFNDNSYYTNYNIQIDFTDGSCIIIHKNFKDIIYFINSKAIYHFKKGKNRFKFLFSPTATGITYKYHYNKGFETYAYAWDGNIETIKNTSTDWSCYNSDDRGYCARLIQSNGWKIPDDYPWL